MAIDEFRNWVEATIGSDYIYSAGPWEEEPETRSRFVCAISSAGGVPQPHVKNPRYSVVLLTPRDGREHWKKIENDAHTLIEYATEGYTLPCGVASVWPTSEPTGPGVTTEGRRWFSMAFTCIV